MEMGVENGGHGGGMRGFFSARTNIVLIAFLAIGGFYLIAEHRAHLLGWLPWLLLLAWPLLHVFMHGGHGGHAGSDPQNGDEGRTSHEH